MSSEDVLLKIDIHYCKSWMDVDVGNDQLVMIVPGMLVFSSFLISVCMFIVL